MKIASKPKERRIQVCNKKYVHLHKIFSSCAMYLESKSTFQSTTFFKPAYTQIAATSWYFRAGAKWLWFVVVSGPQQAIPAPYRQDPFSAPLNVWWLYLVNLNKNIFSAHLQTGVRPRQGPFHHPKRPFSVVRMA